MPHPSLLRAVSAMSWTLLALSGAALAADPAAQPSADIFPPWQHGANTDAVRRGLEFTVPEIDDLADFHGDLTDPKLILYVGGNYFFAMAPLVQEFERQHPEYKGRIYWETIPPGLLIEQIKAGGMVTSGNLTWTVKADAYFAGLKKVQDYITQGLLVGPAVPYVTNTLAIMVPKNNPAHVMGLADLGKPGIHLAMPNPAFEGIARQIKAALAKAGSEALVTAVYDTKVGDGSTRRRCSSCRAAPKPVSPGSPRRYSRSRPATRSPTWTSRPTRTAPRSTPAPRSQGPHTPRRRRPGSRSSDPTTR